ncbi:MAG: ABC transporter permease [Phycisphaerales bacterium]
MAITDLTIISRSMTGRLFSTVTTVITVGVAVGLMFLLLGMRDAGMRAFTRGSGNMHLVVSRDSGPLAAVLNNVFHAGTPQGAISWAQFDALMNRPRAGIPPVIAMVEWAIPLQHGDSYQGFPVVATSRGFFEKFQPVAGRPLEMASGEWFDSPLEPALSMQEPLRLRREDAVLQCVVGAEAWEATRLEVGNRIFMVHGTGENAGHIHEEDAITVVGVLKPTGTAHDRAIFIDLGTSWLLHARDFHERIEGDHEAAVRQATQEGREPPPAPPTLDEYMATGYQPQITGVYIRAAARPGSNTPAILPQLFMTLRTDPVVGAVASPTDQIQALFRIVGNVNQVLLGMAAVVMVSSGIAIMLALYNSMEQRRRQIAVLRVLGASRGRIFRLILAESTLLGAIGAALGLALAGFGGVIVAGVMRDRLGLGIEPSIWITQAFGSGETAWSLPLTPIVLAGAVLLAAAAGVIPAIMAYRTPVARNLRPLG